MGSLRAIQNWRTRYDGYQDDLLTRLMIKIDSNNARDAFATFIPISVASEARTKIIFDFFDLLAAIAAHGKTNGMGGRKLSRLGGWWAFEYGYTEDGFDGGYKGWTTYVKAQRKIFYEEN